MKKIKVKRKGEVQFTVVADQRVRDALRVLGAKAGDGLSREAGRRLTASVKQDGKKPIELEVTDA